MKHQQTAYEYRRYIELVQVLATQGNKGVWALCEAWCVMPYVDVSGYAYCADTVTALAKAAIEHHRAEEKELAE